MPVIPRKLHTKYEPNRTRELFRYHYSCHGNLVTIATRYVVVPIILRKCHTKYGLKRTKDKGVIDLSLWFPWQPSYHSNEVCG